MAVGVVILAAGTFVSLGLLLAGRLRAEVTLAVANLVYLMMLVGGGPGHPVGPVPGRAAAIVMALPTAALGEGLRAAAVGQVLGWPLLVSGVVGRAAAGARKAFRWI